MERTRVKSSVVAGIGYVPEEQVLEIEFRTGRVYLYFDVPPFVHARLLKARSIGRYFNEMIRDHYRSEELIDAEN